MSSHLTSSLDLLSIDIASYKCMLPKNSGQLKAYIYKQWFVAFVILYSYENS